LDKAMEIEFDNQIVAVTGAGSGFGRAIAQAFAAMGARVFACDISKPGLDATASVPGITPAVVDISDRGAAAAWVRGIEQATDHAIQVLVNNAGGSMGKIHQPLEDVTDADWDALFATNLNGTFAVCRAAAGAMKRARRGRIINLSSGAGLRPSLTRVQGYTAAKHAVVGLTRQLAHEFGPFGVTVNSVAPGLVLTTDWRVRQWESYQPAGQQEKLEKIAMRRLGTVQDITNAVIFFASDLAGFVTGHVMPVDGGTF
jgi:3-oxoacyl-[acyl-carrier protein] reductase